MLASRYDAPRGIAVDAGACVRARVSGDPDHANAKAFVSLRQKMRHFFCRPRRVRRKASRRIVVLARTHDSGQAATFTPADTNYDATGSAITSGFCRRHPHRVRHDRVRLRRRHRPAPLLDALR